MTPTSPCCPICKEIDPVDISRALTLEQIAAALAPPGRDNARYGRMLHEVVRLWPGRTVQICFCKECVLGFAWPLVAGDESFYAVLHERTGYPRDRWEFRETARILGSMPARVLDIGAGAGDFLLSLPASAEKHGVEASEAMRGRLTSRGITVHAAIGDAPSDCAVVTMFHVIQYFADPVSILRAAASRLCSTGRLVLSMPNALVGGRPDDLRSPPHPLTRWSTQSLTEAAKAAGLMIERQAYIPQKASSLLWAAHARSRDANRPLFRKLDALEPSRLRTALLSVAAFPHLPSVLLRARRLLRESQLYFVLTHR